MLSENRRNQLDGIVKQMVQNKESDSNVQFVVDDFKKKYENEATPVQSTQPQKGFIQKASEFVPNLVAGAAKAVGSTLAGASSLGEKVFLRPIDKLMGQNPQGPTQGEQIQKQLLQPTNTAQKIGFGAEQIAEFFLPGGAAGKIGKVAELGAGANKFAKAIGTGTRLAAEGVTGSGLNATQQGGGDNFTLNAILYGTLSGLGSAASKLGQVVTKKLPATLVNTALKPTLDESRKAIKFGGDTLGDEVIKRGLAGGDRRLMEMSIEKLNKTEDKLQSILSKSKETIKRNELSSYLDDLIITKQNTPGLNSEVDKIKSILQEFPVEVPIQKANEIKRNIYNGLRDLAFRLDPALSTNKEAMKTLASGIKQEIEKKTALQVGEGVVKGINKDLAVYGKINDRVVDKLARAERNNMLGLGDLVVGGAGVGAGGLAGGVITTAVKRIIGSTGFKTNSALILNKIGNSIDKLPTDSLGRITKASLLKLFDSLN